VNRELAHGFYVGAALFMAALVVWGFWASYFGPLIRGDATRLWIIHVHATIFAGWLLLLLAQAVLVAQRRLEWHRAVGRVGIAYAVLLVSSGLYFAIALPVMQIRAGAWLLDNAAGFLLLPLGDMLLFAGFFGAAMLWRQRPAWHKRLLLAAAVTLTFPAVARLSHDNLFVLFPVWLAPLFAAMALDYAQTRRVHPVHLVSVGVLGLASLRLFALDTPVALAFGRPLLTPWL